MIKSHSRINPSFILSSLARIIAAFGPFSLALYGVHYFSLEEFGLLTILLSSIMLIIIISKWGDDLALIGFIAASQKGWSDPWVSKQILYSIKLVIILRLPLVVICFLLLNEFVLSKPIYSDVYQTLLILELTVSSLLIVIISSSLKASGHITAGFLLDPSSITLLTISICFFFYETVSIETFLSIQRNFSFAIITPILAVVIYNYSRSKVVEYIPKLNRQDLSIGAVAVVSAGFTNLSIILLYQYTTTGIIGEIRLAERIVAPLLLLSSITVPYIQRKSVQLLEKNKFGSIYTQTRPYIKIILILILLYAMTLPFLLYFINKTSPISININLVLQAYLFLAIISLYSFVGHIIVIIQNRKAAVLSTIIPIIPSLCIIALGYFLSPINAYWALLLFFSFPLSRAIFLAFLYHSRHLQRKEHIKC